jgi:hypothetical protein
MVEYDKNGKSVFQFNVPNGARAGGKLPNGQIVCLTQQNLCIRLDASGKELKNFAVSPINNALGAVDLTPQNTILVPHSDQTLKEYDLDGKVVWQIKSPGGTITTASRILNGHTLIVCNNNAVFEVDRAGRVVWEYRAQPGYQLFRARQR